MCIQCGQALIVWSGRKYNHLVLRRSLSGTVGAPHRKPSWAWLARYYGPVRALGIKSWLIHITPMPLVTLSVQLFNG